MNLTLRDAERILLGQTDTDPGSDFAFRQVCTDSRAVEPGDLFVCIEGERFDGHLFASDAVRAGARAVVCSRLLELDAPMLMVRDTVQALGLLARHCRDNAHARVVAVTGSAGKTTLKEMLASCLGRTMTVSKNAGNLNNQIGLPLSIFRADPESDAWILEIGISMPHDMDELGPVAAPDLAVIHNIGPAHLEGLGDLRGVALAKASLLKHLAPGGRGLVNADHPLLLEEARKIVPDVLCFSTRDQENAYYCTFLGAEQDSRGRFLIRTPGFEIEAVLPYCGGHFAENIAAAAAVSHLMGVAPAEMIAGIGSARLPGQRFACRERDGVTLIDDTYNANPLSMHGAVETARHMAGSYSPRRPLVLVLGDMKELGSHAAEAHEELGRQLRDVAPAAVFFHGEHAGNVARGLGDADLRVEPLSSPEQLLRRWREMSLAQAVVLFKGSRSCRMELYAGALNKELDNGHGDRG
ncbi:MAG: UDP-N-acetylmuramoyl-tripeptide--D-alanyl-D-alanine ligase [Desulfovibrionaceae bacterium]